MCVKPKLTTHFIENMSRLEALFSLLDQGQGCTDTDTDSGAAQCSFSAIVICHSAGQQGRIRL